MRHDWNWDEIYICSVIQCCMRYIYVKHEFYDITQDAMGVARARGIKWNIASGKKEAKGLVAVYTTDPGLARSRAPVRRVYWRKSHDAAAGTIREWGASRQSRLSSRASLPFQSHLISFSITTSFSSRWNPLQRTLYDLFFIRTNMASRVRKNVCPCLCV